MNTYLRNLLTYNIHLRDLKDKALSVYNYVFIFLSINYNNIVDNYIHIDYSHYGLAFCAIFALLLNRKFIRQHLFTKPALFWTFLSFFSIVNSLLHPRMILEISFLKLLNFTIVPWAVLGISLKEFLHSRIKFLKFILITIVFFVYAFLTTHDLYSVSEGDIVEFLNEAALIVCFSTVYLLMLQKMRSLKLIILIPLLFLILFFISTSGCRKAFYAFFIIALPWGLSFCNFRKIKSWFFLIIFCIGTFFIYHHFLDTSFVGERMERATEHNNLPPGAPQWMTILDDRARMYFYAPDRFAESPIFGVGLRQTDIDGYVHSEYLAQLLDNGLVGFVLLILFYIGLFKSIKTGFKNKDVCITPIIGAYMALLFISITAWTWQFPQYFILFAMIIGVGMENKEDNIQLKNGEKRFSLVSRH